MGGVFKFKQFEVDQAGCAMKINTDGVLLGAIVGHCHPVNILDIGTGTGVIALMLAQRFPAADIDAVEIDEAAASAARKNCSSAPFSDRITVCHSPFEKYETAGKYDLVVSNPPYFVNDLKNQEKRKGIARHAEEGFFGLLLLKVSAMLRPNGVFWLILPVKQAEEMIVNAVLQRLFPLKVIHIYSDKNKAAFRQIICLGFTNVPVIHEHLYIYEAEGVYTAHYKFLLKDFFLAF